MRSCEKSQLDQVIEWFFQFGGVLHLGLPYLTSSDRQKHSSARLTKGNTNPISTQHFIAKLVCFLLSSPCSGRLSSVSTLEEYKIHQANQRPKIADSFFWREQCRNMDKINLPPVDEDPELLRAIDSSLGFRRTGCTPSTTHQTEMLFQATLPGL